jgi:hypothetical protein
MTKIDHEPFENWVDAAYVHKGWRVFREIAHGEKRYCLFAGGRAGGLKVWYEFKTVGTLHEAKEWIDQIVAGAGAPLLELKEVVKEWMGQIAAGA